MLRVLIVDDEYLLCEHIRRSIAWNELGMEVVGMARDGVEGLRCVRELLPDIVLTDINMPTMDGLEFTRLLRRDYPNVRVLLVTGYEEFEYAHKAIQYGVDRYLLKPVDAQSYSTELAAVRDEILERQHDEQEMNVLRDSVHIYEQNYPQFSSVLERLDNCELHSVGKGSVYREGIAELVVAVMRWQWPSGETVSRKQIAVFESGYDFDHYALQGFSHDTFANGRKEFVALICGEAEEVVQALNEYCDDVKKRLTADACFGISERKNLNSQTGVLHELYIQASRACAATYTLFDRHVLTFTEVGREVECALEQYIDPETLMLDLRLNNVDGVRAGIETAFYRLNCHTSSKENAVYITLMILSLLIQFTDEVGVRLPGICLSDVNIEVNQRKTIQDLQVYVMMLFEKVLESVFFQPDGGKSERVRKTCRYIKEHYSDKELSLNSVANELYLNASYLSSIFSKETGLTLVEYINRLRLKEAKAMIDRNPEVLVRDVADRVGYNNEYYFIRCFKKQYGLPPKAYVKLKRQEEEI